MERFLTSIFYFLAQLGGPGLVLMGVLDSSFLFMPLGNDLLMLGLTANHPGRLPLYAVLAALGSTLGCLLVDVVCRKGGEEGLDRILPRRRRAFFERRVRENAGWTLAVASVLPPPFPFTPFVGGAAALQYPRRKLLSIIAVARLIRFALIGVLAIYFGTRVMEWVKTPTVRYLMIGLVAITVIGSVLSIAGWVRRTRAGGPKADRSAPGTAQEADALT